MWLKFCFSIIDKLDPTHTMIAGRFGKESMCYEGSSYIKDLRYLNRDLSKIVCIETDPKLLKYH